MGRYKTLKEGLLETRQDLDLAKRYAEGLEERIRDVLDNNHHLGDIEGVEWEGQWGVMSILVAALGLSQAIQSMLANDVLDLMLKPHLNPKGGQSK